MPAAEHSCVPNRNDFVLAASVMASHNLLGSEVVNPLDHGMILCRDLEMESISQLVRLSRLLPPPPPPPLTLLALSPSRSLLSTPLLSTPLLSTPADKLVCCHSYTLLPHRQTMHASCVQSCWRCDSYLCLLFSSFLNPCFGGLSVASAILRLEPCIRPVLFDTCRPICFVICLI